MFRKQAVHSRLGGGAMPRVGGGGGGGGVRSRLGHGGASTDLRSKLRHSAGGAVMRGDARNKLGKIRITNNTMLDARSRIGGGSRISRSSPMENFLIMARSPLQARTREEAIAASSSAFKPSPRVQRGHGATGILAGAIAASNNTPTETRRASKVIKKKSSPTLRKTVRNDKMLVDEEDKMEVVEKPSSKSSSSAPSIIIITNLASSITHDDLKELCGTMDGFVSSEMIEKGIAKAEFDSAANAKAMVETYNEREFDGVEMRMRIISEGATMGGASRTATASPSDAMDETEAQPADNSLPSLRMKVASKSKKELNMDREMVVGALYKKKRGAKKTDEDISFTVKI